MVESSDEDENEVRYHDFLKNIRKPPTKVTLK